MSLMNLLSFLAKGSTIFPYSSLSGGATALALLLVQVFGSQSIFYTSYTVVVRN